MIDIVTLILLCVFVIGLILYLYKYDKALNKWIAGERELLNKKEEYFKCLEKSFIINAQNPPIIITKKESLGVLECEIKTAYKRIMVIKDIEDKTLVKKRVMEFKKHVDYFSDFIEANKIQLPTLIKKNIDSYIKDVKKIKW